MKKKTTFKTPAMDKLTGNCIPKKDIDKKFEVAFVGMQIKNGKYLLEMNGREPEPDASLMIKANKQFTMAHALKITNEVNSYMPNLSTGEFKVKMDGIKFNCVLVRR